MRRGAAPATSLSRDARRRMSAGRAILLGVLQGLTEFLPISSSAHLILAPRLLGWADQGLQFDIALHVGSLLALLLYFRRDLAAMTRAPDPAAPGPAPRLVLLLLLGTVPVAVAGLLLQEVVATVARDPRVIATTSIVFGLLLGIADRMAAPRRSLAGMRAGDALLIGGAQALALVPGTSRSGATITAGLFLGFDRATAARFSFLLSVPALLLVTAKDALDLVTGQAPAGGLGMMALGLAAAAVSSYLVVAGLLAWLRRGGLWGFAIYRVALGIAIFAVG